MSNTGINEKDGAWGRTALHWAAYNGLHGLVKALVKLDGIMINVRDDKNATSLCYVAEHGHVATAKLLICRGAWLNVKDYDHFTPLHYAVRSGSIEMVELLLVHGADATARDKAGNTPVLWAVMFNYTKIERLLRKLEK